MDKITNIIATQIDKFVKKVFKLLLELKKEGRTNKSTPII